jgi:hypothetical protein
MSTPLPQDLLLYELPKEHEPERDVISKQILSNQPIIDLVCQSQQIQYLEHMPLHPTNTMTGVEVILFIPHYHPQALFLLSL